MNIEPLSPAHDRGAFCCGNETIDTWFGDRAWKDHDSNRARVYVACEDGNPQPLGFYSLLVWSLAPKTIIGTGLGSRSIPAVYLAMLGRSEGLKGQGIGKALMFDAFERTAAVAAQVGVFCLWLEAADDRLVDYYSSLQFERVGSGTDRRMYIPTATIRDALGS